MKKTDTEVKTFSVEGKPFEFSLKEIRVKQGDKVRLVFTNKAGLHDWVIDEFNARTKQIPAGQSETIEFVADKKGTFEYYCSVGAHRQMG
jgi:plastocyanin